MNTWGLTGLVARLTLGSTTGFYTYDPSGNASQRINGTSPNVGVPAVSYVTDAFGLVTSSDGSGVTFGFSGQFGGSQDSEDGFVLMGHRYYDPGAGRFLTRDPLGYDGGINLYAYTANNPINSSDPSGLYASVSRAANNPNNITITVPIQFVTPRGYRPREVARIVADINSTWTGTFGKYNVTMRVIDVGRLSTKPRRYNEIAISPENKRSFCRRITRFGSVDYGMWFAPDRDFDWVVTHEVGHLMGLPDRYKDVKDASGNTLSIPLPGWDEDIMAKRYGSISEADITGIINASH